MQPEEYFDLNTKIKGPVDEGGMLQILHSIDGQRAVTVQYVGKIEGQDIYMAEVVSTIPFMEFLHAAGNPRPECEDPRAAIHSMVKGLSSLDSTRVDKHLEQHGFDPEEMRRGQDLLDSLKRKAEKQRAMVSESIDKIVEPST